MKKRTKIYLALGVVLFIILLFVTMFYVWKPKSVKLVLNKKNYIVEYGTEVVLNPTQFLSSQVDQKIVKQTVLLSDLLTDSEKYTYEKEKETVVTKDKQYLDVGTYPITLSYRKEIVQFTLEVKDTVSPIWKDFKPEIKIEQNAEGVDLTKYYEATDLSEVQITVDDTQVDLATLGEYEIVVTATDHYGNQITEKAKAIIVDANQADEVTETKDGEKPQSKATKDKKALENNPTQNTNNSNTKKPEPTKTTSPIYRTDISNRYVNEINAYRNQNGEPSLSVSAEAQAEANRRAMELITYYSHDGCGDGYAENIGWGTAGFDFFQAWKNSPGHNRTMLQGVISTVHPALLIQSYGSFAVSVVEYEGKWYAVTSFQLNPNRQAAWNEYWKDAGLI